MLCRPRMPNEVMPISVMDTSTVILEGMLMGIYLAFCGIICHPPKEAKGSNVILCNGYFHRHFGRHFQEHFVALVVMPPKEAYGSNVTLCNGYFHSHYERHFHGHLRGILWHYLSCRPRKPKQVMTITLVDITAGIFIGIYLAFCGDY